MALLDIELPSQEDIALAEQASRALANGEIDYSRLPNGVIRMLQIALSEISEGRAVSLWPNKTELSTFEAARYLNVSRPYVIKLLDEGKMEYSRVGKHRRIPIEQVMAYREVQDRGSYAAMAELQAMAQEEQSHK